MIKEKSDSPLQRQKIKILVRLPCKKYRKLAMPIKRHGFYVAMIQTMTLIDEVRSRELVKSHRFDHSVQQPRFRYHWSGPNQIFSPIAKW